MSNNVRVGIIGTSRWTEDMFMDGFQSHPSAVIAGICGRTRSRVEELAAKYKVPFTFTDHRQLIALDNLDAVVVATPDDLHYEMTMAALDAGLHVLCEKPLALTTEHAAEMLAGAEAAGVKHMVLFTWRWQPHFRYLKQLVDDGYIGRCYHAQFRFMAGFSRRPGYTWRQDGRRSNGVVSDLGAHMFDFARWYIGDVRQVSSHLAHFISHPGPVGGRATPNNDAAIVTLQHENGAHSVVEVSVVAHRELSIEVALHGSEGTLEVAHVFSGPDTGAVIRGRRQQENAFRRLPVPSIFRAGLDERKLYDPYIKQSVGPRLFIDSILADVPVEPDFNDGYKVQQLIDASLESHRTGSRVTLE